MSYSDLPKVQVEFEKANCTNCKCTHQEEDNRLKQWKTWMDIRKDTHQRLMKQTGKDCGDLIMNSAENVREDNEQKLFIQYTNVANKPDKYRGCPSFFELPIALHEPCFKTKPSHFAVKTKEEQCIVPEVEQIRVPDVIKEEKGICTKRKKQSIWNKCKYLQQRRLDLKEQLLEVEPHRPEGDLVIIGKGYPLEIPSSKIDTFDDKDDVSDYIPSLLDHNIPIFRINGEVIFNKNNKTNIISFNFDYDISSKIPKTDFLKIANFSTKALRFSFRKVEPTNSFESYNMQNDVKAQGFFFNINEFIVIPEESKELPIYFKSKLEGVYKETWNIRVIPNIWKENLTIYLKLNCIANIASFDQRSYIIKENLYNKVRDRVIDESLRKVLARVPTATSKYVVYTYDKATLFEAVNSSFSPINLRPQYIYNKAVVSELESFYEDIKLEHHPEVWNLNLNTLRRCVQEREYHDTELRLQGQVKLLEDKIANAEIIRSTREQLRLKLMIESTAKSAGDAKPKKGKKGKSPKSKSPKGKKDKKGKGKVFADELDIVVPLIKRKDIPITLSIQLEDIIKKLHQPVTWANEQKQKLSNAYSLFCAYFDKIEDDVLHLNVIFEAERYTKYPKVAKVTQLLPDRMISEYHDDTTMQIDKFAESCGTSQDKKAEPWVDEIPFEDYEKRYRAFHCIVDDPKSGGKAGKKGGKKDKKAAKKGSKKEQSSKSKSSKTKAKSDKGSKVMLEPTVHLTVIEYDPYAEVVIKPKKLSRVPSVIGAIAGPTSDLEPYEVEPHSNLQDLYNNSLYTIFYNNLSMAIDDLEALLILQTKVTVKHNIIQKVTDGYTIQNQDEPETVKIVDLRRVISEALNTKTEEEEEDQKKKTRTEEPVSNKQRPCYSTYKEESVHNVVSDSSLWDILQKPKLHVEIPLESGEYIIAKHLNDKVELMEKTTSVTHLEEGLIIDENGNKEVQVEPWELDRNVDCSVCCKCTEDNEVFVKETGPKSKVRVASEIFYPDLLIEGTQNFKFYDSSSESENIDAEDNVGKNKE